MEPPSRLEFSNSSGGWLDCSASGSPQPSIDWLSIDGTSIGDVGGIRRVLRNGTLVLLPFPAGAYRQDIHSTIYRCVATNRVGRIISRDVQVRAGKWKSLFLKKPTQARWREKIVFNLHTHTASETYTITFRPLCTSSVSLRHRLVSFSARGFLIFPPSFSIQPRSLWTECIDVEANNHPIIKNLEYLEITSVYAQRLWRCENKSKREFEMNEAGERGGSEREDSIFVN